MIIKVLSKVMDLMPRSRDKSAMHLARRLGWLSIGLGALELAGPHRLSRMLGLRGAEPVIAFYGLREIATGIAILIARDPVPFVWGRVAGDALDITSLMAGFADSRRKPILLLALGSVAMVTAVDLICAQTLQVDTMRKRSRIPDYSDRSGMPKPSKQMRGAARDFKIPADMRTAPSTASVSL